MSNSKRRFLFLMSGSIAAFKACQVISRLVQDGHEVQVAATPSTFEFVGRMTLEGLTGKPVLSGLWDAGHAMDHIHLTRWADAALLCPASANTLARLAHGLADDLVLAMALAWPAVKPFWIFPAMNHQMLQAAATQANLRTLAERGFRVAATQNGNLACGEEGPGRLLEAEDIVRLVSAPIAARGKILITGGATREPIDGIRFISNVSTGKTASTLCEELQSRGWDVTYLHGAQSALPERPARLIAFGDFHDLNERLRAELAGDDFAAVIHCAAVSDYSVDKPVIDSKLSSRNELTLHLKPNFKILARLREYSRAKDVRVIGFKLTLNRDPAAGAALAEGLLGDGVDAVVANDWRDVNAQRSNLRHPGTLVSPRGHAGFDDLHALGDLLDDLISSKGELHDSMS